MRLATMLHRGHPTAVIRLDDASAVRVDSLPGCAGWDRDALLAALTDDDARASLAAAAATGERVSLDGVDHGFPVTPNHVLGIGLNYRRHAEDLKAPVPDEPAWFTKIARTAVPDGETVFLPPESERVTAEAELALVIGRRCWRAGPEASLSHVAGAAAILDVCAEDILQRNPRFLTRSKNFPSFLVLGRDLVTLDELGTDRSLGEVRVSTDANGAVVHTAPVADMLFDPAFVVSFLSHVLPLEPGDVITTGTPGAVVLRDGDVIEGQVSGIGSVGATVRRPPPDDYAGAVLEQFVRLEHVHRI